MNIGQSLHGFTVKSKTIIPELSATLYMMEHAESGAELAFLDREDRNMTFAIAFRTPPTDDTGVFHIIEHSVLCGSEKFPVKEPFVELLKGSLNTFLNAMTYEDRTVYPVASRCEKDFLNLTDIYLDAVFHPNMLKNEKIFLQEGWRYEYDESSDALSYNGVVYNEMCGAYSSAEELGASALRRALFPDNLYGCDSGGDPAAIPTLTYESFKQAHEKYYHPSNSLIFLDGSVNLDKALPLIASYLKGYEKRTETVEYPIHAPHLAPEVTLEFEAGEDSGARLLLGFVCDSDQRTENYALSILLSAISGTNDGDFKRKILESGICEDVVFDSYRSRETQLTVELIGIKEDRLDEAKSLVIGTIRELAREGLDKQRLLAAIGRSEFVLREGDFGSLPRGIAYALSSYSGWIYGEDPADSLRYEDLTLAVREMVENGGFEKLLLKYTVESKHQGTVVMLPRADVISRQNEEKRAKLEGIKQSMTAEELSSVKQRQLELKEWQATPDTRENLDTIPTLTLSDISPLGERVYTDELTIRDARVLLHKIDSRGIVYASLNFLADDLTEDELFELNVLSQLLTNIRTEEQSVSDLQSRIKIELGSLSVGVRTYPLTDGSGGGSVALTLSASALESKSDKLTEIIRDVLLRSDFTDTEPIGKILVQLRASIDDALSQDALGFALSGVAAASGECGRINDIMTGYPSIKKTKELCRAFAEKKAEITHRLSSILDKLCVRKRLILSLTGAGAELAERIISVFAQGEECVKSLRSSDTPEKRGLVIPAGVSYAAMGALSPDACEINGVLRVVRSILSYEYLWNSIRVKGGAYGTGFITRRSGECAFYSYRDPSPIRSVECFRGSVEYLIKLAKSDEDITKFVVGAIGEYDRLMTPRTLSAQATYDILTGWSYKKEIRLRENMIGTSHSDLLRAAELISKMCESAAVCIAASKDTLTKAELDSVYEA